MKNSANSKTVNRMDVLGGLSPSSAPVSAGGCVGFKYTEWYPVTPGSVQLKLKSLTSFPLPLSLCIM